MRKLKCIKPLFESINSLVVEPNKSLSPRQILMQFGQGVSFSGHEPSDDIDDGNYSDDDMVDNTIVFEDEFEAREFMEQPMYPIHEKDGNETETSQSESVSQSSPQSGDQQLPG